MDLSVFVRGQWLTTFLVSGRRAVSRRRRRFVPHILIWRQREIKCRPAVDFTGRPDATAVPADDSLNGRKTHSRSWKFADRVEALENAEQAVGVGHVKTSAVVAHEEGLGRSLG